ncbi:F-box/WD domain containing protein [Entamoeba marina]
MDKKSVLTQFQNDKVTSYGWEQVKCVYDPKIYSVNSYCKSTKTHTKVRTIAHFNIIPSVLASLVKSTVNMISLYSNCLSIITDSNGYLKQEVSLFLYHFVGVVETYYETFDLGNNTISQVFVDFKPDQYESFLYYCSPFKRGSEFIIEGTFQNKGNFVGLADHTISIHKQLVQNVNDYLTGDSFARNMLFLEKEFNKKICDNMERYNLLHQNKLFQLYATPNFEEVMIKGTCLIKDNFEKLADFNMEIKTKLSKISSAKVFYENERFLCGHFDYSFYGGSDYSHDCMVGYTRIDGYYFRASTSSFSNYYNKCPYSHNEFKYDILLDAERLEKSGDNVRSSYCCHYYTPFMKDYSDLERKVYLLTMTNSFILLRLKVQYDIGDFNLTGRGNGQLVQLNQLNKAILSKFEIENMSAKKKQVKLNQSPKPKPSTKGKTINITQLDDNILEKIFSYLSCEDLVSCLTVCERFKTSLLNFQHLWKHIYDLHFNPNTFRSRPFNSIIPYQIRHPPSRFSSHLFSCKSMDTTSVSTTSADPSTPNINTSGNWHHFIDQTTPNNFVFQTPTSSHSNSVVMNSTDKIKIDYCEEVIYSMNLSSNWKNKNQKKNYRISTQNSVNFIKLKGSDLLSASFQGNWEIFNKDLSLNRHVLGHGNIVGSDWLDGSSRVIIGYKNGDVRAFENERNSHSWTQTTPMNQMIFTHDYRIIGYDSKNIIYLYDLQTGSKIAEYSPHNDALTHISNYDENVFISSSLDHHIIGFVINLYCINSLSYDIRDNSSIFSIKELYSYANIFNCFEDYMVVGTHDGVVKLYDLRKKEICMDRTPLCSQITTLNCYNRRLVCGNEKRAVIYFDCKCGYMGGCYTLYNHQSSVTAIALDNETLVSGSSDGVIISSSFY